MNKHISTQSLRFGAFELTPSNRVLKRDGIALECGAKPFDLLLLLVSNAGSLVTREQVQITLWGERTVEFDQAINNYISELRQLLGDKASAPQFIKTVPKHGYIFVAEVASDPQRPAAAKKPMRWAVTGLATAAAAGVVLLGAALMTPRAIDRPAQPAPNAAAVAAYVKGKALYDTHERSSQLAAIDQFEKAIDLDKEYALAWSALADALYYSVPDTIEQSREAANRALAIQPDLVAAIHRRADILFTYDWDYVGAAKEFERALSIDRGDVSLLHSYSAFLLATGDAENAIAELNAALSIDPLSAVMTSDLAWTLNLAGQHEEALSKCAILSDLAPDDLRTLSCPLSPLLALGRIEKASDVAKNLMMRSGAANTIEEPAAALLEFWKWRSQTAQNPISRATAYAHLGEPMVALDMLEQAHASRNRLIPFIHLNPAFQALRDTPRFRVISHITS